MRSKNILVYFFALFIAVLAFVPAHVSGQSAAPSRISAAIDNTRLVVLRGNVHPMTRVANDRGAAPASLSLDHMLLVLQPSADQEVALQTLLAQQQTPSSPNYHKWLTPEQYGQQFGASAQDIQKISSWLQSQGFQINQVARGGNLIDFSGNAGELQQAFHSAIHRYVMPNGEEHWANVTDPQIPAALAPVVAGIASLNNFPRQRMSHNLGMFRRDKNGKVTAVKNVTYGGGCNQDGNCYAVGPGDFAKIYNVPSSANGAGQTIAIVSDSDINASDVSAFRSMFKLPALATGQFNQVETQPSTDPGVVPCAINGDECEAVLDVEWAGAVATGATIDLVVSQSTSTTFGGDTSAQYIVNCQTTGTGCSTAVNAGILSYSYGACELALGTAGNAFYQTLWGQAAAEGITVSVSTGDNGAAGCENPNPGDITTAQPATTGLEVNGVASTPFNVAVGGTDFNDVFNPQTYWNVLPLNTSVLKYIPEIAYNDSCANPIFTNSLFGASSNAETNCNNPQFINFAGSGINLVAPFGGGGGVSNCTTNSTTTTMGPVSSCSGGYAKPSWQTGPGVPADGKRDLPDISLFSGDGTLQNFYIVCEADENSGSTGGTTAPGTCDISGVDGYSNFSGVGGTSVAAQAFAGITALIDQQTGARQGNFNPALYALAAAQTTASCNSTPTSGSGPAATCVFNDVTSGTIAMPCQSGSPNCTVSNSGDTIGILSGFSAGTGFDLATGLGSVNVSNLVGSFPNFSLSSSATSITVSSSAAGTATITATSQNGFAGTITLACGSLPTGATCSFNPGSLSLSANGTASTTLTVTKSSSFLGPAEHRGQPQFPASVFGVAVLTVTIVTLFFFTRQRGIVLALLVLAALGAMASCGGSSSSTNSGSGSTPVTGNSTVNATSTNPPASHVLTLNITVQ
jgi:subtilase family serine protease